MTEHDHELIARRTLTHITYRTAHIMAKRRDGAALFLKTQPTDDLGYPDPTVQDLERYADEWRFLVPEDAEEKAVLVHALAEAFPFSPEVLPKMADALGVDAAEVQAAYTTLYDEPMASVFRTVAMTAQTADTLGVDVNEAVQWRYIKRGEVLFRQGETGDALFVVLDGMLRMVINEGRDDEFSFDLYGGSVVGELTMLTGEPYPGTVYCIRDADLVSLHRDAYYDLVREHPEAMTQLAIGMVQNVTKLWQHGERGEVEAAQIAVLPATRDVREFTQALVEELRRVGDSATFFAADTVLGSLPVEFDFDLPLEGVAHDYSFVEWLQRQELAHDVVVYEADPDNPNWTRRCVEQSDVLLLVGRPNDPVASSAVERIVANMPNAELTPPTELVLLQDRSAPAYSGTGAWLANRTIRRSHHVALSDGGGMAQLVRFVRGRAIGLVFGGGGMRGTAHAGVLKALHEAGIDPDFVGGTSSGSIVTAQVAMGWDGERVLRETRDKLMQRKVLVNLTLPVVAVNSAKRLSRVYQEMFGELQIEDLQIPSFYIATNLSRARMEVLKRGTLRRAVRASTSLVGVHPPIPIDGDLLVDGGIFDNTPADVMREMVGAGTVIAVDLGFTKRVQAVYTYGESLSGFRVFLSKLLPFMQTVEAPGLVGSMLRANALASMDATESQVAHADYVFKPPVGDYGLFDLEAADEIFKAGYDYGKERIVELGLG